MGECIRENASRAALSRASPRARGVAEFAISRCGRAARGGEGARVLVLRGCGGRERVRCPGAPALSGARRIVNVPSQRERTFLPSF